MERLEVLSLYRSWVSGTEVVKTNINPHNHISNPLLWLLPGPSATLVL